MPSYLDAHAGSHPYYLAVTDPRPTPAKGTVSIYGFDVDVPIPAINLPLARDETLSFDFGVVHDRTFASLGFFGNRVDCAVEPLQMDTYDSADQARIRERIRRVAESV